MRTLRLTAYPPSPPRLKTRRTVALSQSTSAAILRTVELSIVFLAIVVIVAAFRPQSTRGYFVGVRAAPARAHLQFILSPVPHLRAPWAITEDGLRAVAEALQNRDGKPLASARGVSLRGSVAVIPVRGPLSKQDSWIAQFFGASTYEGLAKDLQAALDDPSVSAIVLDVDSPGGEVSGCGELAAMVRAATGKKTVVAYASGLMCSAAYWLASGASDLVVDASATVGSIGVRTMMVDASKLQESVGVKVYDIVSSQSPLKVADAASADDRARVRASLDAMAQVFVGDVAAGRGTTPDVVLSDFGRGDVLVGAAAVSAGMADRVGDLEGLIASLNAPAPQGVKIMSKKNGVGAPLAMEKCTRCDRDMDDDDDVYCRACFGADDASRATFTAAVRAALDARDDAEVLGKLQALKMERDALRTELEASRAAQRQAEVTSLLDGAVQDGRVPAARREELAKLAADHGLPALQACLGMLRPAPAPAVPAAKEALAAANPQAAPQAPAEATAVLNKINRATGKAYTAAQVAEHRKKIGQYILNQQEQE